MDEIQAGICDGLTYAEVEERHPDEFAARQADKLRYRYPAGVSGEMGEGWLPLLGEGGGL